MVRQKFVTRKIVIRTREQLDRAAALIPTLPVDADRPLQIVASEEVKARKPDQNSLMWAGPLKDIAEQAWIEGRQHRATVWHEYFKEQFLPDEYDAELCKDESYQKWDYGIDGKPVLVGSTKELTIKGFAKYLEQVYAFGANLGVEFRAQQQSRG